MRKFPSVFLSVAVFMGSLTVISAVAQNIEHIGTPRLNEKLNLTFTSKDGMDKALQAKTRALSTQSTISGVSRFLIPTSWSGFAQDGVDTTRPSSANLTQDEPWVKALEEWLSNEKLTARLDWNTNRFYLNAGRVTQQHALAITASPAHTSAPEVKPTLVDGREQLVKEPQNSQPTEAPVQKDSGTTRASARATEFPAPTKSPPQIATSAPQATEPVVERLSIQAGQRLSVALSNWLASQKIDLIWDVTATGDRIRDIEMIAAWRAPTDDVELTLAQLLPSFGLRAIVQSDPQTVIVRSTTGSTNKTHSGAPRK
jgi:hypothetical protein